MVATGKSGYPYGYPSVTLEVFTRPPDIERAGGGLMFDHHCTSCDKTQQIFPSQVTSLVNTDHGILVSFTCWCGADQALVTGRSAAHREPVAA